MNVLFKIGFITVMDPTKTIHILGFYFFNTNIVMTFVKFIDVFVSIVFILSTF